MRPFHLLLLAAAAVILLSSFALASGPAAAWAFAEDRHVETLSAALFLTAGAVAALRLARGEAPTFWLVLTVGIGVVGFLDELSFGERILGFEPPMVGGVRIDAVHDLLQLLRRGAERSVGNVAVLWAGLLAGLAALAGAVVWTVARFPVRGVTLLAGAVAAVTLAQVLDLKIAALNHPIVKASFAEESLELMAGALMIGFALHAFLKVRTALPGPRRTAG
jgi:hypothetical protein